MPAAAAAALRQQQMDCDWQAMLTHDADDSGTWELVIQPTVVARITSTKEGIAHSTGGGISAALGVGGSGVARTPTCRSAHWKTEVEGKQ